MPDAHLPDTHLPDAPLMIDPAAVMAALHHADAPVLIDCRTLKDASSDPTRLPAARRLTLAEIEAGAGPDGACVAYCQKGGKISQLAAARLRARGVPARALTGGHLGWVAAGLPVAALAPPASAWLIPTEPSWEEVAAFWLLRRYVDRDAPVLAVERPQVDAARGVRPHHAVLSTPAALAAAAGLAGPIPDLSPVSSEALLRGRLARGAAVTVLSLVDDRVAA